MLVQGSCVEEPVDFLVQEFGAVNFGDERLLSRLVTIATMLSARPQASLNQCMGSRSDVAAAYRFFNNDKVDRNEILDSHRLAMAERLQNKVGRVFAVQDTVFFDYTKHFATQGLGAIGKPNGKKEARGLILHHSLVIDENKVPYGIGAQRFWTRALDKETPRKEQKERIKNTPIEDKESCRWLSVMQETEEWIGNASHEIIHLGDRECDIFEFLLLAQEQNYRYVVRNNFSRQTIDGVGINETIEKLPTMTTVEIEVKSRGKPQRTAKLEVKYCAVSLAPSVRGKSARSKMVGTYQPVRTWLVSAEEINPSKEQDKIVWRLFTNVAVENVEQALERINWYKLRWTVEDFHKVLKSGFNVENCRLGTREALERLISLTAVIALTIMRLTFLSRKGPASACTSVLTTQQWQALYVYINKTKILPESIPNLETVTKWIGRLGGHLGRKNDPPPGYVTLWRGWERLDGLTAMWVAVNGA